MTKTRSSAATAKRTSVRDPAVAAVFASYPPALRTKLNALRALIFDVAAKTEGVGALEETLRWNEPAYLTESKAGSMIRIDGHGDGYAMYFLCQTDLVPTFRRLYRAELSFEGNRAIVFGMKDKVPVAALRHCIAQALTYNLRKQK